MKKTLAASAVLTVAGLLAAACGSSTSNTSGSSSASAKPSGGSSSASTAGKFLGCMVTDTGGIDDRSFNASSWQGMQEAASADPSKISVTYLQSTTQSDYTPNINTFISKKCGIIVTVGFLMAQATQTASKANPSAQVRHRGQRLHPGDQQRGRAAVQHRRRTAFLGGYLAAGMSKTGKVATFGGQKLPTVTIYMDGFYDGVQYYNQKHAHARVGAGLEREHPERQLHRRLHQPDQRAERDPDVHHRGRGRHLPGGRATSAWARPRRCRTRTPRPAARRSTWSGWTPTAASAPPSTASTSSPA